MAALLSFAPVLQASPLPAGVDWVAAAADADVDRAFAQARALGRPLLMYWGATWCPPCNQLKATLFNRQDFAAQARQLVAVHVDGDRPGAQRIGARFKVSAYPTLVLFAPDGTEITRLPGEVEAGQVLALLQLGMAGGRPVKAVLADARAGRPLAAGEWRTLSFYSWETGDDTLVARAERPAVLATLARAAPATEPEAGTRLMLKALAAVETPAAAGSAQAAAPAPVDPAWRARVLQLLADPRASRAQADALLGGAPDIVRALSAAGSPERATLASSMDTAMERLRLDAGLSRADRQSALLARIELARIDRPEDAVQVSVPEALRAQALQQVARDDAEIRDPHERQAVVTLAAHNLGRAGLWAESDALLKANLARSHSPYYLMSQLGGNARKLGRPAEALDWYRQAFERSQGPATRLQWGAGYVSALVDLAPQDAARIESTAATLIAEAGRDAGSFDQRSARSLQRMGRKILAWNEGDRHAAAVERLRRQLDGVCGRLDAGGREACGAVLRPAPARAA